MGTIRIVENYFRNRLEFDFIGFEEWDSFTWLIEQITNRYQCKIVSKIDGIAIRKYVFINDDFKFVLFYDDETGSSAYCMNEINNDKLRKFVMLLMEDYGKQ